MIRPNLYDYLKILAILTMIVDHIGFFFYPEVLWLRVVGRLAFPLFLFLVGYSGSYKRKRNIFFMALLLQISIWFLYLYMGIGTGQINILFSIIGIRFVLNYIGKNKEIWSIMLFLLLLPLIAIFAGRFFEYGMLSCVIGFLGYIVHIYSNNLKLPIFSNKYTIAFYALISVVLTYVYNELNFGFGHISLLLSYMHILVYGLLLYIFFLLGQQNYALQYKKLRNVGCIRISKNALYIYVFHLLIFGGIYYFIKG